MKYPKGVGLLGRIYMSIMFNIISPLACLFWLKEVKFTNYQDIRPVDNFIVIANHQSFIDPVLLIYVFKKNYPVFVIFSEYYVKFPLNHFFKKTNQVSTDGSSFKKAVSILSKGGNIFIFPEGEIGSGEVRIFHRGLVTMLKRCPNVKVIPVGISHAYGIWDKQKGPNFFKNNKKVVIRVGNPIYYSDFNGKEDFLERSREILQKLVINP